MAARPRLLKPLLRTVLQGRVPGQLVIQLTDRCNATCPQCGMRKTNRFPRHTIDADEVRRIIDAAAEKGVAALSFTGGEPMLLPDQLIPLIRHAGAAGIPCIRTGTNGFFFARSREAGFSDRIAAIADRLAETPLRNFWISLDSALPRVHESMRGFPDVVAGIEKALPIFHDRGIYPSVNLGINRNISAETSRAGLAGSRLPVTVDEAAFTGIYRRAFRAFYQFIIDLGFTIVNSCYPMSIDPPRDGLDAVYAASSADTVVSFLPAEKRAMFRALTDTIPAFRSKIRIFSPRSALDALQRQHAGNLNGNRPYACRGGIDFFFITAHDANTYPCGYRGSENLGKFQTLNLRRIDAGPPCTACDWECFRDPSELFGPILEGSAAPWRLLKRCRSDANHFRLWMADLGYYRACDWFDGRKPLNSAALARFAPPKAPVSVIRA